VFLPGWEEGLFPNQRSLDESGEKGLEEERRLAYVGITRARRLAKVSFAQNRRTRGLYQSAIPSRFVDDLPEGDTEVQETKSPFGGAYQNFGNPLESGGFGRNPYGKSRFDDAAPRFGASYDTPGWQRAKSREETRSGGDWSRDADRRRQADMRPLRPPITIEGQIIASSSAEGAGYTIGNRVRHQKFGPGTVTEVDGNKLTIEFDHAGRKRVVDSFVARI
jgi:DNA helicase-2/ATP-dependent DNA helicase PcrA